MQQLPPTHAQHVELTPQIEIGRPVFVVTRPVGVSDRSGAARVVVVKPPSPPQRRPRPTTFVQPSADSSGDYCNVYWLLLLFGAFACPPLWLFGILGLCSELPGERLAGLANLAAFLCFALFVFLVILFVG